MRTWCRFHAAIYDRMCAVRERAFLERLRGVVVGKATGTVVEVGVGTGLNFAHYATDDIDQLFAVEPDAFMRWRGKAHAAGSSLPLRFISGSGDNLPLPSDSADSVVATLLLCSVDDPERTAAEFHRVLKPGGTLLFIEHVRSEEPWRARLQDWVTPCGGGWRPIATSIGIR